MNKSRNRAVVETVVALASAPVGFAVEQVAQAMRERLGCDGRQAQGWTKTRQQPGKAFALVLVVAAGPALAVDFGETHASRITLPRP
jgi:hypothetical protein